MRRQPGASAGRGQRQAARAQLAHALQPNRYRLRGHINFDTGVVRALQRLPPAHEASADFGEFFEHYVLHELRTWIDYRRPRTPLAFWRSRSGYEVDSILDGRIAIEAKAARRIHAKHLRGLRALAEERLVERCIVVCREEQPRIEPGATRDIEIWPLEFFLAALWRADMATR